MMLNFIFSFMRYNPVQPAGFWLLYDSFEL